MTHLLYKESVVLTEQEYDILASNVILMRSFKKMSYFNVKCYFVYMMKIHKYGRTFSLEGYAHNVT